MGRFAYSRAAWRGKFIKFCWIRFMGSFKNHRMKRKSAGMEDWPPACYRTENSAGKAGVSRETTGMAHEADRD